MGTGAGLKQKPYYLLWASSLRCVRHCRPPLLGHRGRNLSWSRRILWRCNCEGAWGTLFLSIPVTSGIVSPLLFNSTPTAILCRSLLSFQIRPQIVFSGESLWNYKRLFLSIFLVISLCNPRDTVAYFCICLSWMWEKSKTHFWILSLQRARGSFFQWALRNGRKPGLML